MFNAEIDKHDFQRRSPAPAPDAAQPKWSWNTPATGQRYANISQDFYYNDSTLSAHGQPSSSLPEFGDAVTAEFERREREVHLWNVKSEYIKAATEDQPQTAPCAQPWSDTPSDKLREQQLKIIADNKLRKDSRPKAAKPFPIYPNMGNTIYTKLKR